MNVIDEYNQQTAEIKKKIEATQDKCSHPVTSEKKWGVAGDAYMGTSSRGGSTFKCRLCGKTWSTYWSDDD